MAASNTTSSSKSSSFNPQNWGEFFTTQFEGPARLNTGLIRAMASRICTQNTSFRKKIQARSRQMPCFEILRTLHRWRIVQALKEVASEEEEVRELIKGFVMNPETILGGSKTETVQPAPEKMMDIEEEKEKKKVERADGRVSMATRARTFEQIVAEIGTTRSRRIEQYRKMRDQVDMVGENAEQVKKEDDVDENLEVLTFKDDGQTAWVRTSMIKEQTGVVKTETAGSMKQQEILLQDEDLGFKGKREASVVYPEVNPAADTIPVDTKTESKLAGFHSVHSPKTNPPPPDRLVKVESAIGSPLSGESATRQLSISAHADDVEDVARRRNRAPRELTTSNAAASLA